MFYHKYNSTYISSLWKPAYFAKFSCQHFRGYLAKSMLPLPFVTIVVTHILISYGWRNLNIYIHIPINLMPVWLYTHIYIRIYIYRETRWVFVIGFLTWPTSSKTTPMSSSTTLWFEIHMNEYYETGTISGREIKTVLCHRGFYKFIQKILINFKCCWGPFCNFDRILIFLSNICLIVLMTTCTKIWNITRIVIDEKKYYDYVRISTFSF